MDGLTGALIAYPIDKALDGLLEVAKIIIYSKSEGQELKKKLSPLKVVSDRIYKQISKQISDSDSLTDRVKQYQDFQGELSYGLRLVDKLEKTHCINLFKKYRYGKKVLDLRKKIKDFIEIQGSPYVVHDVQNLTEAVRDLKRPKLDDAEKSITAIWDLERLRSEDVEKSTAALMDLERLRSDDVEKSTAALMGFERVILDAISRMSINPISNALTLQQINITQLSQTSIDGMDEPANAEQSSFCNFQVPDIPNFVVGLDNHIAGVRQILVQDDVNVVGVTGMGGSGKTTLASALCNDQRVKAYFHDIIFITVSKLDGNTNSILDILNTMWDKIVCRPRPGFRGIDDARNQLQGNLMLRTNRRTLVILDDVWSRSDVEQLLFEAKGYKTIITTRQKSNIPGKSGSYFYKMRILEEADALSLFCFWAFDSRSSIPTTEREDLVKQVSAKCHGLPLALKVIGSWLRGQPRPVWESANDDLSRAEFRKDYYKEGLLDRLETSINTLDDEEKQCFLDLGAFPQGGKFCVDSLLDIWVYVRGMKWSDAYAVLSELVSRNLLDLTGDDSTSGPITYNCASELSFSQHHVMRDLALRLASQNSERLFMPYKGDRSPTKWKTLQSSCARFISIHTGAMEEKDWCQTDFREVEALGLLFASSEYCLPTFLQNMPKLKVLMVYNYGSGRARLTGLPSFPSLVQIRSVLLNKLIVPPLYEICKSWERLEKLYVCLCEGLGSINLVDNELEALNFPNIIEINLDHCSDLKELPIKLSSLTSLQRLSITNCHLVPNLPDDLGRLSSLKVLRLSACPSLSKLPLSICKLRKLEYLDISLCSGLQNLPPEFYRLSKLETLDMTECSRFKNLRAFRLRSLKHVIISDNDTVIRREVWKSTIPNLNIHVVPERFSLNWLE